MKNNLILSVVFVFLAVLFAATSVNSQAMGFESESASCSFNQANAVNQAMTEFTYTHDGRTAKMHKVC